TRAAHSARRRARSDLPLLRDEATAVRSAHVPVGASPAERRSRRVGAGAARPRHPGRRRRPRAAIPSLPPARRAAAVARHVLRVAPSVGLRLRAAPSAFAAARRAPHVSPRGHLPVVARRAWTTFRRREGGLPLRCIRARIAARAR